jgi:uncharacterized protein (TIGR02996 family)
MTRRKAAPPPAASIDEQALLADIIEHPGDDTPRLIYADWLDDHGEADRADFIRLQCQLGEMEDVPYRERQYDQLQERVRKLLAKHRKRWQAALPAWAHRKSNFDRAFRVTSISAAASTSCGPRAKRGTTYRW